MMLSLLEEAVRAGARRSRCAELLGLSRRTLERWRSGKEADARSTPQSAPESTSQSAPRKPPPNKLTAGERAAVLEVVNSGPFRDLSPNQIVPRLADEGLYLASESTIYRILRAEAQLAHRGRAKPPVQRGGAASRSHLATGPCQVWSWDITYLKAPVRGMFYYLYLIMDVWSRKIVGWEVYEVESAECSAALFTEACRSERMDPSGIAGVVLHADNGGPMKGATMVATLERLGVLASFSRPGVSNDNPFSESLFRTLKYRPEYPTKPFASLEAARNWVAGFVRWYNTQHLHSAIRFITPEDRHSGREEAILAARQVVYERARSERSERWSGAARNWDPITEVHLNPATPTTARQEKRAAA
jgi:transposase InsO family protein